MGTPSLTFLTDFGDQAVILPVLAIVACVLLVQRRWRLAAAWMVGVAGVLGVMGVLKVADQACSWTVPILGGAGWDLVNPSGHSASAAVVWGCGAGLLAAGRGARTVAVAVLTGVAVAVLVGATRVELGAHSLAEAIVGGIVGCAGALLFGMLARAGVGRRGSAIPVAAALVVMAVMHGTHLAAEPTIHGLAVTMLRRTVPACEPLPGSDADDWIKRRTYHLPP